MTTVVETERVVVSRLSSVLVLIPVFNNSVGLHRTLSSIQENDTISVLVVDDGSDVPIIPAQFACLTIQTLRIENNGGIEGALNAGLRFAKDQGVDFVARLDAGDLASPGRLERQLRVFIHNPEIVVVGGQATVVDESGKFLYRIACPESDSEIRRGMFFNNTIVHTTAMFRLDAALAAGFYPYGFAAKEDHEFFWRLLSIGKGANLPTTEATVELAAQGISVRRRRQQQRTGLRIVSSRWREAPLLATIGLLRSVSLMLVPLSAVNRIKKVLR